MTEPSSLNAPSSSASPTPQVEESSETSYRALVDAIQDYAIFTLTGTGHISSWSPGAQRMKGYAAAEVIGKHFSVFYTPEAVASGWPDYELRCARAEGRFEDEGWRVRKDGTLFWANVTITPIYDESRAVSGFAKVVRDMSERRRLEEIEASSRRMSEFLATLSHELRNPLAPVRNAINLMRLDTSLSPHAARCRDMIDRQISHLTRLVDDLLDVGRIASGKVGLRLRNVDLRDVVERGIESARPVLDLRGQQVDVSLPDEPVAFRADLTRLVQVLQNLLHNAAKFSPAGSRIAISGEVTGRLLELRVSDPGCGIQHDALEDIFSLFVQRSSPISEARNAGLGIGLSLCRSLVELHGGTIRASSAGLGKGSTFTIQMPCIKHQPADTAADTSPRTGALRVLVVDDNRDSADSLAMLLEMLGHEVSVAYEGETARAIATRFSPHLALIDIAMPVMDGFELLKILRTQPELPGTVYVAMTGFGQPADHEDTHAAGFHAHMVKPIEMSHLEMLLATVGRRIARGE
ncbi:hybrid sensor histidine kinase/response regulator [Cupriavidus basilensis]|uniref:hybrid sensor histidine kinase/response regulator n=1 Tax=unclassified Cupriavidus TaxID=2640874 RepID=UPI00044F8678|nr:ATP-binding protein [Cupriavidus sp. SK-3]KDP83766.1 histidine kinase [Cupriavidus sp. SK-3]